MNRNTAKISARKEVAEATYEVEFYCTADMFDFEAGQYLDVIIPKLLYADNKGNTRSFSIIRSSNTNSSVSVVFRASQSGFKRTLLELPIGSEVILRGPLGVFKLPTHIDKNIVFIAGGVGITPFMSMFQFINAQRRELQVTLLYVNSRPERAIYIEELKTLAEQNPNFQLKLKYGYIDDVFIKNNVDVLNNKLWYLSGPSTFIHSMLYFLHDLGIKEKDVVLEEMSGYDSGIGGFSQLMSVRQKRSLEKTGMASILNGDVFVSSILEVLSRTAIVSITDTEGKIIYVNDYFAKISQYSMEELLGQTHRILKSGYHSPAFYSDLMDTIKNGQIWTGEIKNRTKNGDMYWVNCSIAPIFGDSAEITGYIAVRFLITDKKEIEESLLKKTEVLEQTVVEIKEKTIELENTKMAIFNLLEDLNEEKIAVESKIAERTIDLQNEREKLLQVTKNIKEGAILFDNKGTVVFANETLYNLLNIRKEDTELSEILRVVLNYFKSSPMEDFLKRLFNGETFNVTEIEADGKIYEIFFLFLSDTEKNTGHFILIDDITNEKLLERSKSELVAVASHQLRTPLTAMRGNVEMLLDESYGPINPEQRELLADVNVSVFRLITMVNDMLDITKVERGRFDMVCEVINVKELIDSICADLADYANRHTFSITVNLPDNSVVYGDKVRIRQVFQNLIDNAIKYSANSGKLDISLNEKESNVEIIFKDNGIGIPKQEQIKLFGRFYRASNTTKVSSSGSGLGLYIVRSIVLLLGGDIRFESEEGVGTTFFVSLPTKEVVIENNQT